MDVGYLEESFPRLEVSHERKRRRKSQKKKGREARKFPNLRPVLFFPPRRLSLRSSCASRKMPSFAKKKRGMEDGEIFFCPFLRIMCKTVVCGTCCNSFFFRTGARKLASSAYTPYFILFFARKKLIAAFSSVYLIVRLLRSECPQVKKPSGHKL